jgi:hypothetical protein
MKKSGFFPLWIIFVIFLFSGCAGSMSFVKRIGQALGPWKDYEPVPPPQPGLVLPINESEAVWVESFLCEGGFSKKEIFASSSGRQGLAFARMPVRHFIIDPPRPIPRINGKRSNAMTTPLLLPSPGATYTLVAFYQNFNQHCRSLATRGKWKEGKWEIPFFKVWVKSFTTTGNPLNEDYDGVYFADKIIRLPRANPYQRRQLTWRPTFYPAQAIMGHLGFR